MAPDPPYVRAQDRDRSLFQSAAHDVARAELGPDATHAEVLAHPVMRAASEHAAGIAEADSVDPPRHRLAQYAFEHGVAALGRTDLDPSVTQAEYLQYANMDARFLGCEVVFLKYQLEHGGKVKYHDWHADGNSDPGYAVVDWRLPADARVGIIGDWGTGLGDAEALLRDLMVTHHPHALIHLGDIYYSGTPDECRHHFADVVTRVFDETLGPGQRIPVFTMAGNHDYYALGYGYYGLIDKLNAGLPGAEQVASYFCLRSADDAWQFLAMDTGRGDIDPTDTIDPFTVAPTPRDSELAWLHAQIDAFAGATILLSHHQLFSAHSAINHELLTHADKPYLNVGLHDAFAPYFGKIAAWLWGHEHNLALYEDGLFGLAKGRLLGCSAFESANDADPYSQEYTQVPYLDPQQYRVGITGGLYNHGYGIVDLAGPAISYFQFPAWGPYVAPADPASSLVMTEPLAPPD